MQLVSVHESVQAPPVNSFPFHRVHSIVVQRSQLVKVLEQSIHCSFELELDLSWLCASDLVESLSQSVHPTSSIQFPQSVPHLIHSLVYVSAKKGVWSVSAVGN